VGMKRASLVLIFVLAGCGEAADRHGPPLRQGRYAGIGTFPVNPLWSRMAVAEQPKDEAAATIKDDSQIIVTVDGVTGEVRQCGDLSGHCIAMNPWTGSLGAERSAPVRVTVHASELEQDNVEIANESAPAPAR
jgi:hypothetical protein